MAVLRYPSEALHNTTDYFRIDILKYDPPGSKKDNTLIRSGASFNRNNNVTTPINYRKLELSLILPMPSNIQDGNSVDYSDSSLDGLTAKVYSEISKGLSYGAQSLSGVSAALGNVMAGTGKVVTGTEAIDIFTKSIAAQASNIPFGGNLTVGQILARQSGQILNPNMELLFNGVKLRSFKFSFKMTPRDEDEAKEIRGIIRSLKKGMTPIVGESSTFLNSPPVFQLSFRKGNDLHPYLNLFKECFLTDMSVNYTGEGLYATYSDGSPVSYIMDLSFKEIEPIYYGNYDKSLIPEDSVGF